MIWFSRKQQNKDIDGVLFKLRPLDNYQQTEFYDLIQKLDTEKHGIQNAVLFLLGNVDDIVGLKDENGIEIDFTTIEKKEFVAGLNISAMSKIIDAFIEIGKVNETQKKS